MLNKIMYYSIFKVKVGTFKMSSTRTPQVTGVPSFKWLYQYFHTSFNLLWGVCASRIVLGWQKLAFSTNIHTKFPDKPSEWNPYIYCTLSVMEHKLVYMVIFKDNLSSTCKYLISLRHQKIYTTPRKAKFNISLY